MSNFPLLCTEYSSLSDRVTCYVGHYAVFGEAVLAAIVLVFVLHDQPVEAILQWIVASAVMGALSLCLAFAGSAPYFLPPVGHTGPVTSATPNSFPSDHASLAAAIVAAVFFASPLWAVPFAILALVIDWALVSVGTHHLIDVVGSDPFVLVAALVAMLCAPALTGRFIPLIRSLGAGGPKGRGAGGP